MEISKMILKHILNFIAPNYKIKVSFFIILSVICLPEFLNAQSKGGLIGGVNYSTAKHSELSTGYIIGGYMGFEFRMELDKDYYLITQPQFTQIGFSVASKENKDSINRLNYIKIPVFIQQNFNWKNFWFFAQAGPYVALGAGGKAITDKKTDALQFGSDMGDFKALDLGIGISAGIKLNKINLGVGYDLGINDIANQGGVSTFNRTFKFVINLYW